jgi:hypothetical protein
MSKAHQILAQQAAASQIRRWAEGNAVACEYIGYRAEFLYSDGSVICYSGSTPTAYA